MKRPTAAGAGADPAEMKGIIDQLETLLLDLKEKGQGMPVVEKNVRAMLSFVRVLQFGISDLAETGD